MNNDNTNLQTELEQMYVRTEHWISDYSFYDDEVKFLIHLLDRHFMESIISDYSRVEPLRSSARKLLELDKERESIARENQETLIQIARIIKGEIPFDPSDFREEYADIEKEHVGFLKRYRTIKKEIFDLSARLQKSTMQNI